MSRAKKDIRAADLPALEWDPANRLASLVLLVNHAVGRAKETVDWYLREKTGKRIAARLLRMGAILLTALGGVLPIIQQIYPKANGAPFIAPAWASVFVAAAVLLIAMDRFFGFSGAWMRYITAELAVKQAQEKFELDWQEACASFDCAAPTDVELRAAIKLIRGFTDQINTVVVNETAKWISEFQEALRQIDDSAKAPTAEAKTGSVSVEVDNGDTVDAPGWQLAIDRGTPVLYSGKTAAVGGLETGDHVVRVCGILKNREIHAEAAVQVRPGSVAKLSLSLS